ncbi:MAG TPA: YdcF family protein [Lacipirellulaceae bacterium]|nr:YdcF family protein [Lacipirellulaceae bacterium]
MLRNAASLWIVSDPVTRADAIVVLGGNFHFRPLVAADLYRRGLAGKILVSRTPEAYQDREDRIPADAELNRAALLKLGIPPAAIEEFGNASTSTRDEAAALKGWSERSGAKSVIVPTEIFSARRVRWIFRRELSGTGVTIAVPSFEPPEYTAKEWWRSERGVTAFRDELFKYLYYRLRY